VLGGYVASVAVAAACLAGYERFRPAPLTSSARGD
jgi:hypothetical protein